jgi:predicted HTH domain antitoxin
MSVISLRLKDRELKRINELSRMVDKDKSTVARELIEYGWEFLMIKLYREGKMSLGTLSSKLELSISETIDLLAEFGVESPIDYEDYLKGFDVFKVK